MRLYILFGLLVLSVSTYAMELDCDSWLVNPPKTQFRFGDSLITLGDLSSLRGIFNKDYFIPGEVTITERVSLNGAETGSQKIRPVVWFRIELQAGGDSSSGLFTVTYGNFLRQLGAVSFTVPSRHSLVRMIPTTNMQSGLSTLSITLKGTRQGRFVGLAPRRIYTPLASELRMRVDSEGHVLELKITSQHQKPWPLNQNIIEKSAVFSAL